MTYRQSKMYNLAKYLKNLPTTGDLPTEDSFWMKQTVVVSFRGILQNYIYIVYRLLLLFLKIKLQLTEK